MAVSYVGVGAWVEGFSGVATNVAVPAHSAGDVGIMLRASIDASPPTAPSGWTHVGSEYVEGSIRWNVYERQFSSTEGDTTVSVPAAGEYGGGGQVMVLSGAGTGSVPAYNRDTSSDTYGVFPTLNTPGFFVGFTLILNGRSSTGVVELVSGTATGTATQRSFQNAFEGDYRITTSTIDLTAASSALYTQRWSGGNSRSDGFLIAVPAATGPSEYEGVAALTVSSAGAQASGTVTAPAGTGTGAVITSSVQASASGTTTAPEPAPEVPGIPSFEDAWELEAEPTVSIGTSATLGTSLIAITDSRLVKTGWASQSGGLVSVDAGYYRAKFAADTGSPSSSNPRMTPGWGFRFETDATEIEVAYRTRADMVSIGNQELRQNIRVKINGQWVKLLGGYLLDSSPFWGMEEDPVEFDQDYPVWVKFTLPAGTKVFEFEHQSEVAGVRVNSGATVSDGPPITKTLFIMSESSAGALNHGMGEFNHDSDDGDGAYATYQNVSGWPFYLGQSLGYDNIVNGGSSGSGFTVNGNTVRYDNPGRLEEMAAFNPDFIMVGSAGNDMDHGSTQGAVNSACDTVLSYIAANIPDAEVAVMVLGSGDTELGDTTVYDNALIESAEDYGAWVVNIGAGEVLDTDGSLLTDEPAIIDLTSHRSSDGMHYSQYGTQLYGQQLSDYLRYILLETVYDVTGAGNLTITPLQSSGTGTFVPPIYTGSGGLTGTPGELNGISSSIPPEAIGLGDLNTAPIGIAGLGSTDNPLFSGSGGFTNGTILVSGSGSSEAPTFGGSGQLINTSAGLEGSGNSTPPVVTGTADLTTSGLTLSGSGSRVNPVGTATGELLSTSVAFNSEGSFIPPVYGGEGELSSPSIILNGSGEFIPPVVNSSGLVTVTAITSQGSASFVLDGVNGSGGLIISVAVSGGAGSHTPPDIPPAVGLVGSVIGGPVEGVIISGSTVGTIVGGPVTGKVSAKSFVG